jgi:ABC-2 type transport system permease protein
VRQLGNFWNLIQNENMKIYRRVRTWIMLGLVVLIPPLISLLVMIFGGEDLPSNWDMMLTESYVLFILITIFTVVIASETVAGEFTWGTIKLLLIRPWSRSAILLSKYISTLLFAVAFTLIAFTETLLVNMAVFGYSGHADDLSSGMGTSGISNWEYILQFYLFQFIGLIIIVTFGFMMSSAFRSSGLAIGLSITFLFAGSILTNLFMMIDKDWIKYVLFMHLNLTSYITNSDGPIPGHPTSLGFSLGVLAGYFVLFNLISWTVFRKRDITA